MLEVPESLRYFAMRGNRPQLGDVANQRTIALLRKVKEERGWGLAELAEALSVTPTHVSLLLNGKRRASRLIAKSVAETAGVPLPSLLGQRDDDLVGVKVTAHGLGHGVSGAGSEAGYRDGVVVGERGAANEASRGLRLNGRLPSHASERTVALMRELMVERGLSQAHLAALIGTTQPAVSALMAGRKRATYRIAKGLADYVGRPVSELLGGHVDGLVAGDLGVQRLAMAMDAVRSMGYAEGYDRAWVTQWAPRGGLGVPYTADELWALMKADYSRFGAREAPVSAEAREERALVERLAELVERFKSSLEGERAAQPAERSRRKA